MTPTSILCLILFACPRFSSNSSSLLVCPVFSLWRVQLPGCLYSGSLHCFHCSIQLPKSPSCHPIPLRSLFILRPSSIEDPLPWLFFDVTAAMFEKLPLFLTILRGWRQAIFTDYFALLLTLYPQPTWVLSQLSLASFLSIAVAGHKSCGISVFVCDRGDPKTEDQSFRATVSTGVL